jgi:hypothetical protein
MSFIRQTMFQSEEKIQIKGTLIKNIELNVIKLQKALLELHVAISKTYDKSLLKNDLAWLIALIEMESYLLSQSQISPLPADVMLFWDAVEKTINDIKPITDKTPDAWLAGKFVIPQVLRLTHAGAETVPVDIPSEEKNKEIEGQLAIIYRTNQNGILQKTQVVALVPKNVNPFSENLPTADIGLHVSCSEGLPPEESIKIAEEISKKYAKLSENSDEFKYFIIEEKRTLNNKADKFELLNKKFKLNLIENENKTVQATSVTVLGTPDPRKGAMLCLDIESAELKEFINTYNLSPLLKAHDMKKNEDKEKGLNIRGKYYELHITVKESPRVTTESLLKAVKSLNLTQSFLEDYFKLHDEIAASYKATKSTSLALM